MHTQKLRSVECNARAVGGWALLADVGSCMHIIIWTADHETFRKWAGTV